MFRRADEQTAKRGSQSLDLSLSAGNRLRVVIAMALGYVKTLGT